MKREATWVPVSALAGRVVTRWQGTEMALVEGEAAEDVTPEVLQRRSTWFERYASMLANSSVIKAAEADQQHRCPCCLFRTLQERGGFEICEVCFWEDDGQDEHDSDIVRGGPNGSLSLSAARQNFAMFGASEERFKDKVRSATAQEIRAGDDHGHA
jgi:hypothetical protein